MSSPLRMQGLFRQFPSAGTVLRFLNIAPKLAESHGRSAGHARPGIALVGLRGPRSFSIRLVIIRAAFSGFA
jgi:hypothetical protein